MFLAPYLSGLRNFPWERSGTTDLSRRPKIFVKAGCHLKILGQDFAKRAHFRPSENLGKICRQHFYPYKVKRNLVRKILGKIKIFVQDFVPIRTAMETFQNLAITHHAAHIELFAYPQPQILKTNSTPNYRGVMEENGASRAQQYTGQVRLPGCNKKHSGAHR